MHINTIINRHRSIIILNGEQPAKELFALLNTKVPVIAADGAAHRLFGYGLTPTFIVGDGDSCGQENPYPSATVIRIADQNSTDFEKCMRFAKQSDLLPCLILGINGGEIDHIVGNMQMLARHAQGQNFYFLDTYPKTQVTGIGIKLGLPLDKQTLTLQVKPECTISFISFHEAIVQSQGLEWELHNQLLTLDGILSLRNRSKSATVSFTLKNGNALVVIDITDLVHMPNH
jgi:thiamine pyrophosphokinase